MTDAAGAMCATHSETRAIGTCTRCGTFVCNACGEFEAPDNQLYCHRCAEFIEAPLATVGQRFVAALLDGLSFLIGLFASAIAAGTLVLGWFKSAPAEASLGAAEAWILLGFLAFIGAAVAQVWAHVRWQQSLGKRYAGIRVVHLNGSAPGLLLLVFLRNLVPIVFSRLTFGVFGLVDYLFAFRADRRRIADHLCSTRVVVDIRERGRGA